MTTYSYEQRHDFIRDILGDMHTHRMLGLQPHRTDDQNNRLGHRALPGL